MCLGVRKTTTRDPKPPEGVATNSYKKESVVVTIAGSLFGLMFGGPMGALIGAGGGAGLHRTLWKNEETKHRIQVDHAMKKAAEKSARAQEIRDTTIAASVTVGTFAYLKKAIWG